MAAEVSHAVSRSRRLAEQIERTVTGPMWHGPALAEVLADVTAEAAAARPIPGAHSIWELVLHVSAWAGIARARLEGKATMEPTTMEDWPTPSPPSIEAWRAAVDEMHERHRELAAAVAPLEDEALDVRMPGRSHTVWTMLHGVAEHGTYHGGQMLLLKRALARR